MTDLDATNNSPSTDMKDVPRRPGPWRALSLMAVVAALIITALAVLQARAASDVAAPERLAFDLEETNVIVTDLATPSDAEIAVMGLPSDNRTPLEPDGTLVQVPEGFATVLAMTDAEGSILGLALARVAPEPESGERASVTISARSTAHALLALSPGLLLPSLDETLANVGVAEADPAFDKIVAAVRADSNISRDNGDLEQAYAELADRLPIQRPPADQGCDSVVARTAYPAVGACVQPRDGGVLVSNEQDRWVLAFHRVDGIDEVCSSIAPADSIGDEIVISSDDCRSETWLAAPGPEADYRDEQARIDRQVRIAAGVNALYEYVGPFADLAAGSAGFARQSTSHIRRNATSIATSLSTLVDTSEEFAAALEVSRISSTATDRQTAAVSAARLIIEAADGTAMLPQRDAGDLTHQQILSFYVRSSERMVSPRTDWRWLADAAEAIEVETDS